MFVHTSQSYRAQTYTHTVCTYIGLMFRILITLMTLSDTGFQSLYVQVIQYLLLHAYIPTHILYMSGYD